MLGAGPMYSVTNACFGGQKSMTLAVGPANVLQNFANILNRFCYLLSTKRQARRKRLAEKVRAF